ncbi:hypothetical protein [Streptomyces sp. SA15]|uniref:hypothetical protein n=1 Tax=Streptomyces sp. SA15 TaxID=934019 RepID=UPI0015CBCB5B|nr:hypothetical protein [Streptomyces sp. SA15]
MYREKPKLLDVAVTRAERRLFVIGDHSARRRPAIFATLSDSLPVHAWQPGRQGE